MLAKSWTGKYFPVGGAQLVVHFANSAFEMEHEFTRSAFPSRFTIPPASLDPSVPRSGPYLFNGGRMQNLQCSAIYASRISPHHNIITRIFHKFRWKQRKQSDRRTCKPKPMFHLVGRSDFFWKYGGINYGENQCKRSHQKCFLSCHFFKVARFCNWNILSKRLKFHSENRCQVSKLVNVGM